MKLKLILFLFFQLFIFHFYGQSTSSPYSYFGPGTEEVKGSGISRALGGTGIGMNSRSSLNNLNPASYAEIDSMSFIFEFGMNAKYTDYKTSLKSNGKYDANLNYLAMGFKIKPWWGSSIGVTPFSSVGYIIEAKGTIEGEQASFIKTFSGEGGISQLYFGNSFRLIKNLYAGINASYLFGAVVHSEVSNGIFSLPGYKIKQVSKMNNVLFDFGLQYTIKHRDNALTLGLIYGPSKKLITTQTSSLFFSSDTIELRNIDKQDLYYPEKKGIGFSYRKGDKYLLAFDYSGRKWSQSDFGNALAKASDVQRFSGGFEISPAKSYKVQGGRNWAYRIGGYYENSGIIVKDNQLHTRSVSVGIGIPMRKELSRINISLEAGDSGTTTDGLVKENFFLLHLNLSLQDQWFMKRKFD